jgi:putative oxidoreductase
MNSVAQLIGRILLASVFVQAGYRKLFASGIQGTIDSLANHGFPFSVPLAYAAAAGEMIGGIMLIVGLWSRFAAIAFFIYIGVLAALFHNFWAFSDAAQHAQQMAIFYFHLATMGGMAYVAVFGPGSLSIQRK